MKSSRSLLKILLGFLICLFLFGCGKPAADDVSVIEGDETLGVEDEPTVSEELEVTGDEVEIRSMNAYQDWYGDWIVLGFLHNVADYPVGDIVVEVEFFDSEGVSIHTATLYGAAGGLVPGESIPFSLYPEEPLPKMDHFEANVVGLVRLEKDTLPMEIQGVTMEVHESGLVKIVGEIVNPSEESVVLDRITAAVFNDQGDLLLTEACNVCVHYLDPGGHGPFKVQLFGLPVSVGVPADYTIYVSAVPYVALEPYEIKISEKEYTYMDMLNWFHVLGEVSNNTDDRLVISLLSNLYDSEGNVLGAASYRVLPRVVEPGESGYYDMRFGGPSGSEMSVEQVARWETQVDRKRTGLVSPEWELIEIATSGDEVEYSVGVATIEGQVVNDSGDVLQGAMVVAALRDRGSGYLVGLGYQEIYEEILDGGQADYSVSINIDPTINIDGLDYFIHAEGRSQD
jgi:hypothetical protein